jgi:hypothetical protein
MPINFNTDPYYDDYDESKNFHRILFRPGLSVQNRELIQMQTILQEQIKRHGSHIFKEGAKVFGAEFSYTPNLAVVKVQELFGVEYVADYAQELVGKTIVGGTSGVEATILAFTNSTDTDPLSFYVTYTATGKDRVSTEFIDNEQLLSKEPVFSYLAEAPVATTLSLNSTAIGIGASITRGVYYVKGFFVLANPQFYIVSKYGNTLDGKIGLNVIESVITSADDESLLDNAGGTPNFAGRGADRYVIDLTLTSYGLSEEPANFIEIERVENGGIISKTRTSPYNELAKNLAQRTFDINGNFVVKPFSIKIKEALNDYRNEGVYETGTISNDGNLINDDAYAVAQLSEGKAFVYGFEVESIGSKLLDIEKPRDVRTVRNSAMPIEIGNFIRVNNVLGMPDAVGAGNIISYPQIKFFDTATVTPGTPSGELIGVGRVRSIEFDSGDEISTLNTLGADTAYKMYLFDIKMLHKIVLNESGDSVHLTEQSLVRGQLSGAFGYLNSASDTNTLFLTSVSGKFTVGETLISNNSDNVAIRNAGNTADVVISSIEQYSFDAVKQLYYDDPPTNGEVDTTADLVLENRFALTGTASASTDSAVVTGFNSSFLDEVRAGDIIEVSGIDNKVLSVQSDTELTLDSFASDTLTASITRKRALINDQEKNLSIRQLAKSYIKTLKPLGISYSQITFRKQYYATSNSSGVFTVSEAGSQFLASNNEDYQVMIVTAGTGTGVAGDMINIEHLKSNSGISGEGTDSLTISSAAILGDGAVVKINTTIVQDGTNSKTKTAQIAQRTRVDNLKDSSGVRPYGTSAHHNEVSLGVSDVFNLLAVYDSNDPEVDATTPQLTFAGASGSFTDREIITGVDSGASAIVLNTVSPIMYVPLSTIDFIPGEIITGETASATISVLVPGSKSITERYLLDTGQRDNYYDIAKVVLKQKAPTPQGRLLVVYNSFEHGGGLFFDVDSYSTIDYKDIPYYSATRIDPGATSNGGIFDLRSSIDYRPRVANTGTVTSNIRTVSTPSFDFESRKYSGAGSSATPVPKDNILFTYDYEYYLGRNDTIWLTINGEWVLIKGEPSENPILPEDIPNAMRIADIFMPPYVLNVSDIDIEAKLQKRYRMEDIDKLAQRIDNVEYYTSLSLLEGSVESLQVKDSNGLDRFKSGFLVDSFGGHKTGDAIHQDYRCSIDMVNGVLRPKYDTKNIDLVEKDTGNTGYSIKDNIVTLAYTHLATIEQPFATRIESLTPVLTSAWVGNLKMEPSSDSWFEIKRAPDVTKNVDGNYNAVLSASRNSLGTLWGASRVSWTGTSTTSTGSSSARRLNTTDAGGNRISQVWAVQRFVTTSSSRITQQGVRTSLVERTDTRLEGDRVIANDIIPFMRKKTINFTASGLRPFTRVFPFFDNVNVTRFIVPTGGSAIGNVTTITGVNSGGAWSTISKITLDEFYSHNHDAGNTSYTLQTSTDSINWVSVKTASFASATETTIEATGLAVLPNAVNGELYIRFIFDNPDHMAFKSFEVYDQDGALITRELYELESNTNFTNATNAIKGSGITQTQFRPTFDRCSISFKVIDGPKSTVPQGGLIRTIDNDTLDPSALVSDGTGRVSGRFTIPDPNILGNPKFRTGERTLRLTSSPTDADTGVTTAGEGVFSAKGVLQTKQRSFIATRNAEVRRTSVSREFTSTVSRGSAWERTALLSQNNGWVDPLAQSFQITTEGGEFLTKVDVFFEAKDSFIPVRIELREMENGTPTSRIIPNSVVSLDPEDVLVSAQGTVATVFEFNSPIYVKDGVEVALVLLSDSEEYRVFISKLGEANLTDQAVVSRQPYLGVLFKSQNSSTWTAYDNEDLKFTLYRAKFDIGSTTLTLKNAEVPFAALDVDSIELNAGSNVIQVFHNDHHMYDINNSVEIKGVTSGIYGALTSALGSTDTTFTFNAANGMPTSGTVMFKLYLDITNNTDKDGDMPNGNTQAEVITASISESDGVITGTVISRNVDNTQPTPISFVTDSVIELYEFDGIQLTEVNKKHPSLTQYNMDSYTVEITSSASTSTRFGGSNIEASQNVLVNSYQLMIPTVVHNNTGITTTLNLVTGSSHSGTETPFQATIQDNTNTIDLINLSTAGLIASNVNEADSLGSVESCRVDFFLSTDVDNLSPVVDLERATITAFANRVENISDQFDVYPNENYVAPTEPEGDSGESIYITKRVQLENPATALKVYLDGAVLNGSNIQVMYKILRSDDSVEFDEIGWSYFNTNGYSDDIVNPSVNIDEFKEHSYSQDNLSEFIGFSIKIRMIGNNSSAPPLIKSLRAMALAV